LLNSVDAAVIAAIIAFFICAALCPLFIPRLVKFKFGQQIRSDGPATHAKKAGVPTMGGTMIILALIAASAPFLRNNPEGIAVVAVTAAFSLIGFLDDYVKIKKKRSLGLRAYQKLLAQIIVSVAFVVYWKTLPDYSSFLIIPFFHGKTVNAGFLYPILVCFVFLSSTNGSNLTDGLDGLDAGVTVLITAFFFIAAVRFDSGALPVIGAAIGSLLGFLLYNSHPARVIMGDTGSLALGGFVASVSVILRMPLFLLIVAVIYVFESVSVIIQVGYFKLTKERFFKMAPIHHSFELSGWPETRITSFFCIITVLACLTGYLALG